MQHPLRRAVQRHHHAVPQSARARCGPPSISADAPAFPRGCCREFALSRGDEFTTTSSRKCWCVGAY
jgi:hypothetical protein